MSDGEGQALIYVAYANLMRQLQVMELSLWQIKALRMKPGIQSRQTYEQIVKLDGTTFGKLVRGMKTQDHWPDGLVDELEGAVELRNYLAHHFLREFFLASPSQESTDTAMDSMVAWSLRLEALDDALTDHIATLPGAEQMGVGDELAAEFEKLRPKRWPLDNSDD